MVLVMADSQAPVSSMTRVARSKCSALGSSEVRNPSHLPATLLKSVTAVGCHLRVSVGAMELQATMRCKKAKPINPTTFFIYILLWQVKVTGRKLTLSLSTAPHSGESAE